MIEVKNLTKRYGNHTAVDHLSFCIPQGQIFGFLGPNGAGKSTTMNIMTGCLAASEGQVTIGGYDIYAQADKAKKLMGYLPEQPPVYMDRTPREYLAFVARAKKIPAKQIGKEVARVMKLTKIVDVADRLIRHLSKGYCQRVGIAQAILGDPQIIILDEPTVGLDPIQIVEIRDLIRKLGNDHTVILSSHILSEVQAVCNQVMIIANGKLLACDTPANLEQQYASTVTIDLTVEADSQFVESMLVKISQQHTIVKQFQGRTQAQIRTQKGQEDVICRQIFHACRDANSPILCMNVNTPSLEDIFIQLTQAKEGA